MNPDRWYKVTDRNYGNVLVYKDPITKLHFIVFKDNTIGFFKNFYMVFHEIMSIEEVNVDVTIRE